VSGTHPATGNPKQPLQAWNFGLRQFGTGDQPCGYWSFSLRDVNLTKGQLKTREIMKHQISRVFHRFFQINPCFPMLFRVPPHVFLKFENLFAMFFKQIHLEVGSPATTQTPVLARQSP
jgi:hypothetical protein